MESKNCGVDSEVHAGSSSADCSEAEGGREGQESGDGVRSASNDHKQDRFGNIQSAISKTRVIGQCHGKNHVVYHGDSCEVIRGIPDNSVHHQVMSPPFADLFVYSNSERDLGNCRGDAQFFEHYSYLVREQFRVHMPGRLCAIHVMQLPTSKARHGVIGLRDFRGDCIRIFQAAGWIYHSEVCIWKNPVTAMQRTKALGLLHKQLKKDSCMSRQGVADYLLVFRKPGVNPEPVTNDNESFPIPVWQRYASPVWASFDSVDPDGFLNPIDVSKEEDDEGGIDQGNTLQREEGREERDEKHLCCLQLGVIKRAIRLWSNPGDVVFSPFTGIGSEGYQAVKMGRKFIGIELKESYYKVACQHLSMAESESRDLFDLGKEAV